MKNISIILVFLAIACIGYSQNKIVPCSNNLQNIKRDSVYSGETTFKKANLFFLAASTKEANYINSKFYNQVSFFSSSVIIDSSKRKDTYKNSLLIKN